MVGSPLISCCFDNGADEIVLCDISASKNDSNIDPNLIKSITENCRIPLTVTGGIKSREQAGILFRQVLTKLV